MMTKEIKRNENGWGMEKEKGEIEQNRGIKQRGIFRRP